MNKTQKGFAALEGLLILIIVAIIGGIGWYAYNSKTKTDKILSQADQISQSTPIEKQKEVRTVLEKISEVSLDSVPSDLKAVILNEFGSSTCKAQMTTGVSAHKIEMTSAIARYDFGCDGGQPKMFALVSNKWEKISDNWITPNCNIITKYQVPIEFSTYQDESGKVVSRCSDNMGIQHTVVAS